MAYVKILFVYIIVTVSVFWLTYKIRTSLIGYIRKYIEMEWGTSSFIWSQYTAHKTTEEKIQHFVKYTTCSTIKTYQITLSSYFFKRRCTMHSSNQNQIRITFVHLINMNFVDRFEINHCKYCDNYINVQTGYVVTVYAIRYLFNVVVVSISFWFVM